MINNKDKESLKKDIVRGLYKIEFIFYYIDLYDSGNFNLLDFVKRINSVGGDLLEELDYSEPNIDTLCGIGIKSYGLSGEKAKQFIQDNELEVQRLLEIMKKDYEDLFKELYGLKPDYKLEIPQITEKLIK